MKKDEIFLSTKERVSDFDFNSDVADVFDDMLVRSVPFYLEQQNILKNIAQKFWQEGTSVYDLGCSTATTLIGMCENLPAHASMIGYDNSLPMIAQAERKIMAKNLQDQIVVKYADLNGALSNIVLDSASVVTMCWTLQFIRPLHRDDLIRWIYNGLTDEGILIVTEKVLTNSGHMNRFFIDYYYDFKRKQGYSETEISRKREALENVLVPYRLEENLELFHRNGFEIVETFFQWFNFSGFLCVKKPASASTRCLSARE